VTPGVVAAHEDGIGRSRPSFAKVAMESKHVRLRRSDCQWGMRVQDVSGSWNEGSDVEPGPSSLMRIQAHELGFRYGRLNGGEERDSVTKLCQSSSQPHHHSLGASIPSDGKTPVEVERDVHAAPMYRHLRSLANPPVG
jgi:hypothetical protein